MGDTAVCSGETNFLCQPNYLSGQLSEHESCCLSGANRAARRRLGKGDRHMSLGRSFLSAGLVFLLFVVMAGGCIAVGGNERHTHPTLGCQLIDLKKARECGAINEGEYRQAKEDLLHGRIKTARAD